MKERLTIEIIDQDNWLIIDNKTGADVNPVDGVTNVLKGLVKTINKLYNENKELKEKNKKLQNKTQPITLTTHISDEDWQEFQRLFKVYCDPSGSE